MISPFAMAIAPSERTALSGLAVQTEAAETIRSAEIWPDVSLIRAYPFVLQQ
jgi:hypothetical protein